MSLDQFWNPLRSYTNYKKSEYVYISNGIDSDMTDVTQSSLAAKLKGTFFMFSGYLGNPDHLDLQITTDDDTCDDEEEIEYIKVDGTNHVGMYDYLTLGIPGAIEAFFRGNFLQTRKAQNICQAIFTFIIPIVPVLATIRNSFGVIATIVSFFPVLGIDLVESLCNTPDQGLQKAVMVDRIPETVNSNPDTNIDQFLINYKALSLLFRNNNHPENLTSEQKKEFHKTAGSLLEKASFFSCNIPESSWNNPDLKLGKRLNKIAANGEYSEQQIEEKFGYSI